MVPRTSQTGAAGLAGAGGSAMGHLLQGTVLYSGTAPPGYARSRSSSARLRPIPQR